MLLFPELRALGLHGGSHYGIQILHEVLLAEQL